VTRAHDTAFEDRIREVPALQAAVFDGEVDGRPQMYVLVHSNRGIARPDRLAGPALRRRQTYWVHSVGASKKQADAVAEKVIGQLVDFILTVEGYTCERITHEASEPVQKDDSRQPDVYFGVDQFDFYTTPDQPVG
jgi:hypothetical protein